jgi:hypothetical protein
MTLTVFQVGVDVERAESLDSAPDFDVRILAPPASGESVADRPWPPFTVFQDESPHANFYHLHDSFLILDQEAMSACRSALDPHGESIKLDLRGVAGDTYLYNPWMTLDLAAVDWSVTRGRYGCYSNLTLNREAIPRNSIFRLPKIGGLYVSSEGKEDVKDLHHLYYRNGLRGLYFKKLWDEASGPAPGVSTGRGDGC